jgi:hypothetical protein
MVKLQFAFEGYETDDEIILTIDNPLFIPRVGELVTYGETPTNEEIKTYNEQHKPFPYLDCAEVELISYSYEEDITYITLWF